MAFSLYGIGFENEAMLAAGGVAALAFLIANRGVLKSGKKAGFVASRCAIVLLLFAVIAMPYSISEEEITQQATSILFVDDRTDSMSVSDANISDTALQTITSRTASIATVDSINLSESNKTAIGEALYQGILGSSLRNNVVVLFSDGNNNYGPDPIDVATFAASANTKIFALLPDIVKNEIYVRGIEGSGKMSVNSEYFGKVIVGASSGTGSYSLRILADGAVIADVRGEQTAPLKEYSFKHVFNERGAHNITAQITPESGDLFTQNNIFHKVVNVIERPKILLVSAAESPLKQVMEEVYEVDVKDSLPAELSPYSAIVLDDKGESVLEDSSALRDFLNDGGGFLAVGGNRSYERGGYYESELENFLPVRSREAPQKEGNEINIAIIIDISGSTGNAMSGNTKIDVEKAIAVKVIRDLYEKANLGVVAFNSESFAVQALKKGTNIGELEDKVSRLTFGGGTYVITGLTRAHNMLKPMQGAKYAILISDGVTNYPVKAFEEAGAMAADGITVHSVGVGFDTDSTFMKGIATRGNGIYFEPSEADRLRIVVGQVEEDTGENGYSMIITNPNHFITDGLEMMNLSITDFNDVSAKSSAQVLASTPGLKPLLTVWRFGLGRVASLTVDDGSRWANNLYAEGNSRLISSTINWVIGDPEKNRELRIECADTAVGEAANIVVVSKKDYPEVYVGGEKAGLNRLDDTSYYFNYAPKLEGFDTVSSGGYSCGLAVNYPQEYGSFGINTELLAAIAGITGGEMYTAGQLSNLINDVSDYTASESTGKITKKENLQMWFSLAALIIFFLDIAARRIREIFMSKEGKEGDSGKNAARGKRGQRPGKQGI